MCKVENNKLVDVVETFNITKVDGKIVDKEWKEFTWDEIVSMNFRGFHQDFVDQAQTLFDTFVLHNKDDPKAEMQIPPAVDQLIHDWVLTCEVIQSPDSRQGVTHPDDKQIVQKAFDKMNAEGVYPNSLREQNQKV